MLKNKKFVFLITGILLILITFSCILIDFHLTCSNYEEPDSPNISASIEGENNILISNISRNIEFSDFGVVHIEDFLEIVNNYNNPITSIVYTTLSTQAYLYRHKNPPIIFCNCFLFGIFLKNSFVCLNDLTARFT